MSVVLNTRYVLEMPARSGDGSGGYERGWTQVASGWAEVSGLSGRDSSGPEMALSTLRGRITLRAVPINNDACPRAGYRIRAGGRTYLVDAVYPHAKSNLYLTCVVSEEVAK